MSEIIRNNKYSVAVGQYLTIDGQIDAIREKLRLGYRNKGSRCPLDPDLVIDALQNIIEGKFSINNEILKLLCANEIITIDAVYGNQTFKIIAEDIFKGGISYCFEEWSILLDRVSKATEKTPVQITKLVADSSLHTIFNSLSKSKDLEKLCLTQSQIRNFCLKYKKRFWQDNSSVFFLFMENKQYFVAHVSSTFFGLHVNVQGILFEHVWKAKDNCIIVTPKKIYKEDKY
ncbi:MAG: hypothetical protein NTY12_01540 [Candidatus Falkowbacteria bacterium]|nr:hypothetical protein [Candidatus Falkowbacteria bacterium]